MGVAEVLVHIEAEAEYTSAMAWYLARNPKAADRLEAAFERALDSIAANPESYPVCDDRHRFCQLPRLPYSVIYRIAGDQVQVIALAHSARLPGYWSDR